MPIHPALQPVFAASTTPPDSTDLKPAELREQIHQMMDMGFAALGDDRPPVASEVDHHVALDGREIVVRVYRPDLDGLLPCHVYLHGGGFFVGTLDHADSTCRGIAADAGCVVASVDYRLAPEHPFPAAVEDSDAALCWVVDHASKLGVDPSRVSVGGGSSGGNLAAVLARRARDRGAPPIVLQVLEIPVTDFTTDEPLVIEDIVVAAGKAQFRTLYLPDAGDWDDPDASPLLAEDLAGLPPALVMCAEYDPLCREGMAYADRMADAGVQVESRCWEGQFHGSQGMTKLIPEEAAEYDRQVVSALRRAYGTTG